MREAYKFVGFSSDVHRFAEVERFWASLFEQILSGSPAVGSWLMAENGGGGPGPLNAEQRLQRRFDLAMGEASVMCCHDRARKGVRIQQSDPVGELGTELSAFLELPYEERPASFSAFMSTSGEPGDRFFRRELVILCELSSRTEALSKDLIRRWVLDGEDYERMQEIAGESEAEGVAATRSRRAAVLRQRRRQRHLPSYA